MNEAVSKMTKTSKILSGIFKFVEGGAGLGIIVALIGLGIIMKTNSTNPIYLDKGKNISLNVWFPGEGMETMNISTLKIFFLVAVLYCIIMLVLFHIASGIFREIEKSQTPFITKIVKEIRVVSILFFILSTFPQMSDGSLTFGINAIGIIGGLLIWCLSYIIQYGCILQQESDETL